MQKGDTYTRIDIAQSKLWESMQTSNIRILFTASANLIQSNSLWSELLKCSAGAWCGTWLVYLVVFLHPAAWVVGFMQSCLLPACPLSPLAILKEGVRVNWKLRIMRSWCDVQTNWTIQFPPSSVKICMHQMDLLPSDNLVWYRANSLEWNPQASVHRPQRTNSRPITH